MPSSSYFVNSDIMEPGTLTLRDDLLNWYFANKRTMPWRAEIGVTPNPYHVLVSEFMLQQTTVQTVIPFFERFIERFPTLEALAESPLDDVYTLWQGLGYYSRAKNLHKAALQICNLGTFPQDSETLKTLSGVGPYTSASISAIAFDQPTMPVDGNVMRVMSRLFTIKEPKGAKLQEQSQNAVHIFASNKDNTHSAQALMELGAVICKPKKPLCNECPLSHACQAYQTQSVENYPILPAKTTKPKRTATTYVITNQSGDILLVKRPDKGLFSNMFILPTTCFDFESSILDSVIIKREITKPIKHVFSHFDLELTVTHAEMIKNIQGIWAAPNDLQNYGMPTLMHKVIKFFNAISPQ